MRGRRHTFNGARTGIKMMDQSLLDDRLMNGGEGRVAIRQSSLLVLLLVAPGGMTPYYIQLSRHWMEALCCIPDYPLKLQLFSPPYPT